MATDAVAEVKGAVGKAVSWLRWLVYVTLWVVLFLIILRSLGFAGHVVPNIGEASTWIYAAGFYWLISR